MCGIVGIASRSPAIDRELPQMMRDRMRHRGPDDAGIWQSPDAGVIRSAVAHPISHHLR